MVVGIVVVVMVGTVVGTLVMVGHAGSGVLLALFCVAGSGAATAVSTHLTHCCCYDQHWTKTAATATTTTTQL